MQNKFNYSFFAITFIVFSLDLNLALPHARIKANLDSFRYSEDSIQFQQGPSTSTRILRLSQKSNTQKNLVKQLNVQKYNPGGIIFVDDKDDDEPLLTSVRILQLSQRMSESKNLNTFENGKQQKKSNPQKYNPSSIIIFDEDNDEPLLPEPVFKDRIFDVNEASSSTLTTLAPPKTTASSTTTKPTKKATTTTTTIFEPIMFVSSTNSPLVDTMNDCVEIEKGDCDEILIEGSVYTPFLVRKSQILPRRQERIQARVNFERPFIMV